MSAKNKTTVIDKIPQIIAGLKSLNGREIEVGIFDGEQAYIAAIQEYGCDIEVTPKMRAWLHRNGLHIKDSTTHIHIPERSFLRNGHDEKIGDVMKQSDLAIPLVLDGKLSEQQFLDLIGEQLATEIKTYARDLSDPPNHPFTIDRKGSSNPLVGKSGGGVSMIESIEWKTK